jgi:hypothetical protein
LAAALGRDAVDAALGVDRGLDAAAGFEVLTVRALVVLVDGVLRGRPAVAGLDAAVPLLGLAARDAVAFAYTHAPEPSPLTL